MGHVRRIEGPWQSIQIDYIGPLPAVQGGYKYCLVLVDVFSKWVEVLPLVLMGMRASQSKSTGYSPHELMTGRIMRTLVHVLAPVLTEGQLREVNRDRFHLDYGTGSFCLTMSVCRFIVFQFLVVFGHSAKQCYLPKSERPAVNSLLRTLLRRAESPGDPYPDAFLALRLANRHNLEGEDRFQEQLAKTAVRKVKQGENFPTGLTALYTLAFRSACLDPASISDGNDEVNLVKLLDGKLKEDMNKLESNKKPLTDYDQLTSAALALCIEKQPVPTTFVEKLIDRIMTDKGPFGKDFSIETASMSVLALKCLRDSPLNKIKILQLEKPIMKLLRTILGHKQNDWIFGTVYTTGLVVQAFLSVKEVQFKWFQCSDILKRLIDEIPKGTFNSVQRISQVIPALEGRTYLDVRSLDCTSDQDNLSGK
uniref:cobalamin binding intrinsic factor-like n=1 Tax=Pristiophorus japonicus TaxID=55135 RepID=UPI00398F79C3